MAQLLDCLRSQGWKVELTTSEEALFPDTISKRYQWVPLAVTEFLASLASCRNRNETVWFVCRGDFSVTSGEGFNWNEYERMAVDAAGNDEHHIADIHEFWDNHFPVMLAVHSDYDYLAIRKSDGVVVHGFAPEWEDPTPIAATFEAFLLAFEAAACGDASYPLNVFL